jgi:hypothetical protein
MPTGNRTMNQQDRETARLRAIQARADANAARELADRRKREGFNHPGRQPESLGDCLNDALQHRENAEHELDD